MNEISWILIFAGIVLVLIGLALGFGSRIGLGNLPGDFSFNGENFRVYFPLATSIILSIILAIIISLVVRFFR